MRYACEAPFRSSGGAANLRCDRKNERERLGLRGLRTKLIGDGPGSRARCLLCGGSLLSIFPSFWLVVVNEALLLLFRFVIGSATSVIVVGVTAARLDPLGM